MFLIYSLQISSISIFYLLMIKNIDADMFREIIEVPFSNDYFVVLESGLYLYDSKLLNCSKLFAFNSSIYKFNYKINLTQIEDGNNSYIFCLMNKYLFIYAHQKNELNSFELNEIDYSQKYYCNLLPYQIKENSLTFFIVYYKSDNKLYFYFHEFFLKEKIYEIYEKIIDNINVDDIKISCHINNKESYIICFYYYYFNNKNYLESKKFSIGNINIKLDETFNHTLETKVNMVNSVLSIKNNKFFICLSEGDNRRLVCYIKNYFKYDFEQLDCTMVTDFLPTYKMYYFKETDYFMAKARVSPNIMLVNIFNNSIELCNDAKKFTSQQRDTDDHSIIYNDSIKDYILLNTNNFSNSHNCYDISNMILFDFKSLLNITIISLDQIQDTTIIPTTENQILSETVNFYTNKIKEENSTEISYISTDQKFEELTTLKSNFILITDYIISSISSIILTDIETNNKLVTNKSKEEIFNNVNDVLKDKEIGEIYEIKGDDFTITIKPTNTTPLPNTTYVEFDECEQKIRKENNISNSSIITFVQIELENKDDNSLYNQIKYYSFDDQMREIDLSLCKDINTQIHYAIKSDSKLDILAISDFQELGVDILNLKDKFFNDLCYSYSEENKDMILEDRIKYIYQNYSLCETGCSYDSIDIENMNIACNCKIQDNNNQSALYVTSLFYQKPNDISIFDSNIGVVKCYKMVFSMYNKSKNIGFILFCILCIFYLIFIICFCINGIEPVKKYLIEEMTNKGYLTNSDNKTTTTGKKIKSKRKFNNNCNVKKKKKKLKKKIEFWKTSKRKPKCITLKKIKNNEENTEKNISQKHSSMLPILNNINKNNKNIKNIFNKKITKKKDNNNDNDDTNNFGIIKMNLNDIKNYFPKDSNQSLHNYTFDEAIKHDKRNIFRVSYIYLLSKQIIFKTFLQRSPLELFPLRFCLFIFMFSSDLALNALFYFNDNISKKYTYAKNLFLFTFTNNITIIIYSTLISHYLITFLSKLSNSSNSIRKVFSNVEQRIKTDKKFKINEQLKTEVNIKIKNILKNYKIKIAFLFLFETILILCFWYFVTAFCHVYSSTQMSWLLDSFLSVLSRLFIELIFAFFFGKLYQISVGSGFVTIYKIVMFLYEF